MNDRATERRNRIHSRRVRVSASVQTLDHEAAIDHLASMIAHLEEDKADLSRALAQADKEADIRIRSRGIM